MSVEDLDAYVWSNLPAMKYLAGRRLVSRLTKRCARQFPSTVMVSVTDEGRDAVLEQLHKTVERHERQNYKMGFILTMILSALLTEIIKALFAWWLASASNKALLLGWQREQAI